MTGIVDFRTELTDEKGEPIEETNPLPVVTDFSDDSATLLIRILNQLGSPTGYDKAQTRFRVLNVYEGTQNIGTVTSVTSLTNFGNFSANSVFNQANLSAWALCVRARIT